MRNGICRVCGQKVMLRKKGDLTQHWMSFMGKRIVCAGSGMDPRTPDR